MDTLPLFLHLDDQPCVVVGGGAVAARKVEALARAGARITVVAPRIGPAIADLEADGRLRVERRPFADEDVRGALLAIAATGDREVNRRVYAACRASGVLVNTVDDPSLCTVTFPAIVDRGPVTVAVSTGGSAPALARHLREKIEQLIPSGTERLARFLGTRRADINLAAADGRARRRLWDRILDGPIPDLLQSGREEAAEEALGRLAESPAETTGLVSLVGAGPGDPDLLTIKAVHTLQRADIVYYDNLVSPGVLDRCRRDADRVYVGKRARLAGSRGTRQAEINELLLASAREGLRVVRLKGGDPFVFGRGGEEIETLHERGIAFEVVPGITAALGCAAFAGIPLTHRDWAQSVRFVTGHVTGGEVNLDWPELARPGQTLVVYMGLAGLMQLTARLIEHGMAPETPAATVSRGTLPDQAVVTADLATLAEEVARARLPGPTTTIVGRVVALRDRFGPATGE